MPIKIGKFEINTNISRTSEPNIYVSTPSGFSEYWRETYYLHADGAVQLTTEHEGVYSGYFRTVEEAMEAIHLHNSLYQDEA